MLPVLGTRTGTGTKISTRAASGHSSAAAITTVTLIMAIPRRIGTACSHVDGTGTKSVDVEAMKL
jgi:hypothetical protein